MSAHCSQNPPFLEEPKQLLVTSEEQPDRDYKAYNNLYTHEKTWGTQVIFAFVKILG